MKSIDLKHLIITIPFIAAAHINYGNMIEFEGINSITDILNKVLLSNVPKNAARYDGKFTEAIDIYLKDGSLLIYLKNTHNEYIPVDIYVNEEDVVVKEN